jgi:hypothetical protein
MKTHNMTLTQAYGWTVKNEWKVTWNDPNQDVVKCQYIIKE